MNKNWKTINTLKGFSGPEKKHISAFINKLDKFDSLPPSSKEVFSMEDLLRDHLDNDFKTLSILRILGDLSRLGWMLKFSEERGISAAPPELSEDPTKKKSSIRAKYSIHREEQLMTKTHQDFISRLEKTRSFKGNIVSIFSLMRDGKDLAEKLLKFIEEEESVLIPNLIDPYLQPVGDSTENIKCEFTGLPLTHIFRYFRHTWIIPSHTIPGRSLRFLVRDKSAPFHPVIGIFAVSNANIQQSEREQSIGWDFNTFMLDLESKPLGSLKRLVKQVEELISFIRQDDFFAEGILKPSDLHVQNDEALKGLKVKAKEWREDWHTLPKHRKNIKGETYEFYSETALYRAKRAEELSFLLKAKFLLKGSDLKTKKFKELLANKSSQSVLRALLKRIKSQKVGINIADLTICGALPPYNLLIGGKLVAALAVSPEVVSTYKRKYSESDSIIASSMAGRSIYKAADLVYISTSSLFGLRPNQYDNISIPLLNINSTKKGSLKYKFLGRTKGTGTMQFSKKTMLTLTKFMTEKNVARVNYVQGEGTSPKLRAVRSGLRELGFNDTSLLLNHGMKKTLYGVTLISNLKEYLLGKDNKPKYFYSLSSVTKSTRLISAWWAKRWALKRIQREQKDLVLEISKHNLSYPIKHGARVKRKDNNSFDQKNFEFN